MRSNGERTHTEKRTGGQSAEAEPAWSGQEKALRSAVAGAATEAEEWRSGSRLPGMERSRNRAGGQSAQGADDGGWLWSLRNASCRRERTSRLPGGGTKASLRLCGPEGRSEHERGSAGACGGCTPKWHGAAGGQGRRGEQTAEAEATKDVRAEWSQGADPEPAKGRHPGGAGPGGRRSRSGIWVPGKACFDGTRTSSGMDELSARM